jgi:hypothetical protein
LKGAFVKGKEEQTFAGGGEESLDFGAEFHYITN